MSADLITVLRSPTRTMAKVWKADGSIQAYDTAKTFTLSQERVAGIVELSTLLSNLERDPHACIIRGTPTPETLTKATTRRLIENFDDLPLHSVLIEIDGYEPVVNDPVSEPLDACLEYVAECLPAPFQDASFHWQLSNSAGAPGNEIKLKAHIWFWLETPYDSATLKAWAKAEELQLDRAVLQPVQVHYTAAPVFEPGAHDPIAVRSGYHQGVRDAVPLAIDTSVLQIKAQGVRQRGERRDLADPLADWIDEHWETWGDLLDGGIVISCPFEHEHTAGRRDGDTSTAYFPAGTGGYADGMFICLHNACRDRPQAEFKAECGYAEQRLAGLAEPMGEGDDHGLEPLPNRFEATVTQDLPRLARTLGGEILATLDNLSRILTRPDVSGMAIRLDSFKEEIVRCAYGSEEWDGFRDIHYTALRQRLENTGFKPISKDMMRDAVHLFADTHVYDSARDWLSSLVWDGVPRIETFWIDHFGVPDDAPGYARAVGRYTWTALAGRALKPGVQADMVPILTGRQGLGKSRGLMAMSPVEEFFTTMSFHEPEVERARKMRGRLIVELAELQGLKSREREEIKAWVTRSSEHWTPKWNEMTTVFRRRCLICGTTNDDDFLDDPTGERRWLPLAVGRRVGFSEVDTAGIEAVRDQLWAEGAALFGSSGIAWSDAERLAAAVHEDYRSEDAWADALHRWLDTPDMGGETPRSREWVTTQQIAEGALLIPARQIKYQDQRRIAALLKAEGYEQRVRRIDGRCIKAWAKG